MNSFLRRLFTVTVTLAVEEHEPPPFVTVYVVVEVGFAVGFEAVDDDNPVDGDQEYELPSFVSPIAFPLGKLVHDFVKFDPALTADPPFTMVIGIEVE